MSSDKNIPYIPYCKNVYEDEAKEHFERGFKVYGYWKANKYYEDKLQMYSKAKVRLLNHSFSFYENILKIKTLEFPIVGELILYISPDKYEQKQKQTQPTLF